MNFQKTWQKKFYLIKYIQKHNKYYTKITLLKIFRIFTKICICTTYDTSWLLSTVTLYGYDHIWCNMFIDNLSVPPIALYHICYTRAVERQNHSFKTAFFKLFSSGDHFYQSKCSTEHPTLVPFESKFIIFINVLSIC
jgi:hypothetical protein